MSNIQTFVLNINPKNGTVVIPKKARLALGQPQSVILKISQEKVEILVPEYTLDEILYQSNAIKTDKTITDKDIQKALEDGAVERFKKSNQ
jgi:bifunctional DNA-binding transcriptional regulator/antitoxin component of YhaV-PrlF toxin-antitoxin module